MKIVVACDSFKGCMSSQTVSEHMRAAIHRVDSSIEVKPYVIADGGEGTVDAFAKTCGGEIVKVATTDAYGRKITSYYTIIEAGRAAVIEVANIIGLNMHPREKRTPLFGSSFGVGTVLLDALQHGCKKIIIGLGGSATNDGGMGLLQALGCRFYDYHHRYLSPQAVNLERIRYIDFNRLPSFADVELIAACDVKNRLLGAEGATYIFGKQKGFYPNQIKQIDDGMTNYRNQIERYRKVDIDSFPGSGAAGGVGSVLIGLLGAKMIPGIELLLRYSDIHEAIRDCDFVITGEGQSDRQTMFGKVPVGILNVAKSYEKPVLCISGALGLGYQELYDLGFSGIFSIADRAMTFQQALAQADQKLEAAVYAIVKTIMTFYRT